MGEEGRLEMFHDSLDFIRAFLTPLFEPLEPQPSWKSFLDMPFSRFFAFLNYCWKIPEFWLKIQKQTFGLRCVSHVQGEILKNVAGLFFSTQLLMY